MDFLTNLNALQFGFHEKDSTTHISKLNMPLIIVIIIWGITETKASGHLIILHS